MYNLIVLPSKYRWDGEYANLSKERYLEYTDETLIAAYSELDEKTIAYLKSLPAIFASEMGDAYIGQITDIIERRGEVRFYYMIDEQYEPLNLSDITNRTFDFDTHNFECSRSHWALKDVDLYKALKTTKLLKERKAQNLELNVESVSTGQTAKKISLIENSEESERKSKVDWQTFAAIATIFGVIISAIALFL